MMDEETRRRVVAELVSVAGFVACVLVMDQRARIEARALARRAQAAWASWRQGEAAGERTARWWLRDHDAKVITEAERLTKEGGE